MEFYKKPPYSMTEHQIEIRIHEPKKTRAYGETLDKQYNHAVL